jgi:hypothetical protein
MRIILSSGKSTSRRRAICSGLQPWPIADSFAGHAGGPSTERRDQERQRRSGARRRRPSAGKPRPMSCVGARTKRIRSPAQVPERSRSFRTSIAEPPTAAVAVTPNRPSLGPHCRGITLPMDMASDQVPLSMQLVGGCLRKGAGPCRMRSSWRRTGTRGGLLSRKRAFCDHHAPHFEHIVP